MGEEFNLEKLRYHKIILMCDADVDGCHIRTLLLTFLYRQMKPLIEGGFVYIAQPPLYKVTRGKREEYIETESEMNGLILELGMEGLKFVKLKGRKEYASGPFKEILTILVELEKIAEVLRKRGVEFKVYIENVDQKFHKMPLYMVKVECKDHFVYDDKELAEMTQNGEEVQYIEIFEAEDIQGLQQRLSKYDLSIQDFLKRGSAKPLFLVEGEKDKNEFHSLSEVLHFVRGQATKGMHIQRYKGLGEMNPQQLWDTTMDPGRRTILKVALEDAVEVDKTFSILMGDEVEPRRQFIESFAHEVKNLDV